MSLGSVVYNLAVELMQPLTLSIMVRTTGMIRFLKPPAEVICVIGVRWSPTFHRYEVICPGWVAIGENQKFPLMNRYFSIFSDHANDSTGRSAKAQTTHEQWN